MILTFPDRRRLMNQQVPIAEAKGEYTSFDFSFFSGIYIYIYIYIYLQIIYIHIYIYNLQFARNFSCQERGSRSCPLLNSFNGTSLSVSHWKLRMDTYGWVSIQLSQPKQAILRTSFDFDVFFSGLFRVLACPVAYAPLDLMH